MDEYVEKWDFLYERFHRESVYAGSIDKYYGAEGAARGRSRVDKVFLAELEEWRVELAGDVASRNAVTIDELNFAVQSVIDRIVFLRVCEDRGLEPYGDLLSCSGHTNVYEAIKNLFDRADQKYNSGLFHFKAEKSRPNPDRITPALDISDRTLANFVRRLYWPTGPYDFAVLPPDILGQVYEQFLGKVIHLTGRIASVQEKPEVRKAGGVFYTPTNIVRDIVNATLGSRLRGATPERLSRNGFFICDPACGSGSFLIEVYQHLLDWYLHYYTENYQLGGAVADPLESKDRPAQTGALHRQKESAFF